MSLSCQVSLSYSSYTAGQNPAPMATVFVYNPNASAVVVTGIQMSAIPVGATAGNVAVLPSLPPTGPGMTTSVPALSSITIGPFPIVVGSAANANAFQAVQPYGATTYSNPQGSQPPQSDLLIGATVYGSDLSVNVAGVAPLLVSYYPPPPPAFQGGYLQFSAPNNLVTGIVSGVV